MQAIVALKAQYCERMDGKEWDRCASLFTYDAVMQFSPSEAAALHVRDAIQLLVSSNLKRV